MPALTFVANSWLYIIHRSSEFRLAVTRSYVNSNNLDIVLTVGLRVDDL
jgi:hypothetical protein